jgi:hypothetical protein
MADDNEIPPEVVDIIVDDYRAGRGLVKLHKELGITVPKIRQILTDRGIKIRPVPKAITEVTSREKKARVLEVVRLIVKGYETAPEICEIVNSEKGKYRWNVTLATVENYLRAANLQLIAQYNDEIRELRAVGDAHYRFLYQLSLSQGDPKTALAVRIDRNKFHGLYPAQKLEHSGRIAGTVRIVLPDNGRDPKE